MIIRTITTAAAAIVLTTGAVAALADNGSNPDQKVTISKTGAYCITDAPMTGSRIGNTECHSQDVWAKQGVTFARR